MEQDAALEEEDFDMAASRPPLMFGLPYMMSCFLMLCAALFVMLYSSGGILRTCVGDVVGLGAILMFGSACRALLRNDFHGWGNFVSWVRLDARALDSRDCGGARLSSFPVRSPYRCGAHHDH